MIWTFTRFRARSYHCQNLNFSDVLCGGCRILTPLLRNGSASEARGLSQVPSENFLGIQSHAGFLTVKEEYGSNMFFWFFPAETPLKTTPWIIWLQGGPGYSSMYGLFNLVGPLRIENGEGNFMTKIYLFSKLLIPWQVWLQFYPKIVLIVFINVHPENILWLWFFSLSVSNSYVSNGIYSLLIIIFIGLQWNIGTQLWPSAIRCCSLTIQSEQDSVLPRMKMGIPTMKMM